MKDKKININDLKRFFKFSIKRSERPKFSFWKLIKYGIWIYAISLGVFQGNWSGLWVAILITFLF
jgi:hypothetical protein